MRFYGGWTVAHARKKGSGNVDKERQEVLSEALAEIIKRYGDGAVMRLGEATHLMVEVVPTGSLALDLALGVGGIPRGRVTEIYGPSWRKRSGRGE